MPTPRKTQPDDAPLLPAGFLAVPPNGLTPSWDIVRNGLFFGVPGAGVNLAPEVPAGLTARQTSAHVLLSGVMNLQGGSVGDWVSTDALVDVWDLLLSRPDVLATPEDAADLADAFLVIAERRENYRAA